MEEKKSGREMWGTIKHKKIWFIAVWRNWLGSNALKWWSEGQGEVLFSFLDHSSPRFIQATSPKGSKLSSRPPIPKESSLVSMEACQLTTNSNVSAQHHQFPMMLIQQHLLRVFSGPINAINPCLTPFTWSNAPNVVHSAQPVKGSNGYDLHCAQIYDRHKC